MGTYTRMDFFKRSDTHLVEVPSYLFSHFYFSYTLHKTDPSLRWTDGATPNNVHPWESWLYYMTQIIIIIMCVTYPLHAAAWAHVWSLSSFAFTSFPRNRETMFQSLRGTYEILWYILSLLVYNSLITVSFRKINFVFLLGLIMNYLPIDASYITVDQWLLTIWNKFPTAVCMST